MHFKGAQRHVRDVLQVRSRGIVGTPKLRLSRPRKYNFHPGFGLDSVVSRARPTIRTECHSTADYDPTVTRRATGLLHPQQDHSIGGSRGTSPNPVWVHRAQVTTEERYFHQGRWPNANGLSEKSSLFKGKAQLILALG